MSTQKRLDGSAKVFVAVAKKPFFPEVVGNAVVVSDRAVSEGLFTTAPVFSFSCSFQEGREGREVLTRDIPSATPHQIELLDPRGIVKVGTTVRYGDILVGKIMPRSMKDMPIEERLLHSIFGSPEMTVNSSLYYHFRDSGMVSNVEILSHSLYTCAGCGSIPCGMVQPRACPFCGGVLGERVSNVSSTYGDYEVKVDVVVRRVLAVGDVLQEGKGNQLTVARIVPYEHMPRFDGALVDMLVAADSPLASLPHRSKGSLRLLKQWHKTRGDIIRFEKVTTQVADKLAYRCTGWYGSFTELPIASPTVFSGQKVTEAVVTELLRSGYPAAVRELLTIKADAVAGRSNAYEALVKGESVPRALPDTTKRLWSLASAVCLKPRLLDAGGTEVPLSATSGGAVSLAFQRMSAAEIRAASCGEVKTAAQYQPKSERPQKDGIFCECIFGTDRDWKCACDKYQGVKYKDATCGRCGVTVTHSRVRRSRPGHIELALPVMHPWYLDEVAILLGLAPEIVQQVLAGTQLLDTSGEPKLGPLAIKECLTQKGVDTSSFFLEAIPVLPAGLRPGYWDTNGRWRLSDLSSMYGSVIERSNRLRRLYELNAPPVIIQDEHACLQRGVEALFCNEAANRPFVGEHDAILHSLRWEAMHLLESLVEKRVDYSGRMVVSPHAELQRSAIGLPAEVLCTLYQPLLVKELKAKGVVDTIKAAKVVMEHEVNQPHVQDALATVMATRPLLVLTDEQRIGVLTPVVKEGEAAYLHPEDALALGIRFAGEYVTVHLPLGDDTIAELHTPSPVEDLTSALLDSRSETLLEMMMAQKPLGLSSVDRIVLGIE